MTIHTPHFGTIAVDPSSAIEFPEGLPGFEGCRRFVSLERAGTPGLIFLQSLEQTHLCFIAIPVRAFWPDYEFDLSPEEGELLTGSAGPAVEPGRLACLAILSFAEGEEPTANLLAPVVIDPSTRRALQLVRCDGRYAVRATLPEGDPVCS